ncbi:hypothetical protein GGQ87_001505 [Brevundimonas alba]|uniref:Uncharacterized protein n=1 Tax=Brevundimonas alba TaxID=74314 RepID=A0A7X5YJT0_9CAUL|nr:hypothetical protein [Brevundimonas alba]NJC41247.1 hypothetical protein [Brevundimonas alba]
MSQPENARSVAALFEALDEVGREVESVTVHTDGRIEFTLTKPTPPNALDLWRHSRRAPKS